ncbi:MAG: hypothetical protein WCA32_20675, partial [Chromatiaceae bacterium]
DKETLPAIQHAKRTLMRLRRQLWPTREVINSLLWGDGVKSRMVAGARQSLVLRTFATRSHVFRGIAERALAGLHDVRCQVGS